MVCSAFNVDLDRRKKVETVEVNGGHGFELWKSQEELYCRLQIFMVLTNGFWGGIIIPGCVVLVVALTVASLYCSLRLHGLVHPLVYAFFPILAVFMLRLIVIAVFVKLSDVHRNATGCVDDLEMLGKKLRLVVSGSANGNLRRLLIPREVKKLRPFGVQNGSFGYIQLDTQVAMIDEIINYVLLLLTW